MRMYTDTASTFSWQQAAANQLKVRFMQSSVPRATTRAYQKYKQLIYYPLITLTRFLLLQLHWTHRLISLI